MYCWSYGVSWPESNEDPTIKVIYSGFDESAAINTAKENKHKFSKVVTKSMGVGCLYRWVSPLMKT